VEVLRQRKEQVLNFYQRHEAKMPAAFFLGGFLFDVVTLDRIDSLLTIFQQAAYLTILSLLAILEIARHHQRLNLKGRLAKWFEYHEAVTHFIFGSLLSSYTLFFFKSASYATSFGFMIFMATLLVLNEFPKFQKFGILIRAALLSLCFICYYAYLVPTIMGFGGLIPFGLSLALGLASMFLIYWLLKRRNYPLQFIKNSILLPSLVITAFFVSFYIFQLIPPVPIALQNIGIYHSAKRQDGSFYMQYYRSWWKFWQNGAQTFYYREGDKLNCFFSIFSPSNFKDNVKIRWLLKDSRLGWMPTDAIPVTISGGRDQGFRGVAVKSNFQEGDWQVRIETNDGREIGRLNFEVIKDTSNEERVARFDVF